jgi:hypothetical protein
MVQFKFQLGDRRGGGLRVVPIYAITDWRIAFDEDGLLTFRPSWRTVWRRSGITLVAVILLGMLIWSKGFPWQAPPPVAPVAPRQAEVDQVARELQAEVERNMTPEQRRRLADELERGQQARERRAAAARAELGWLRRIGWAVHWTLFEGLIALGLLPLLLAAWERVDLWNGPEAELVVRRRRFLTRERTWPRRRFGGIMCEAVERVHRGRRRWTQHMGWFWVVRLLPRHEHESVATPQHIADPVVEFHLARQADRPSDGELPPESVRAILKQICRLAGIEPRNVRFGTVPDPGLPPRGFWERRRSRVRRQSETHLSEPVVESETYDSADEMPPEIQARVRELMRQGLPPEGITEESVRITIRDADGNEQTYTSVDDLPPEVRAMYDVARRKRRRK